MDIAHQRLKPRRGDIWASVCNSCRLSLFLLIVLLSHANQSEAQIYKWVDKHGVIHFGQAPQQGAGEAAKMEATRPAKTPNAEFDHPQREPEKTPGGEQKPQVVEEHDSAVTRQVSAEMYSTSWCGYCRKAREYFRTRGIALIEYDIEIDAAAAERKRQIDIRPGVPLVVINGQLIHGYAPALYEQALTQQR